ncbi:MAG: hypothetical protein Q8O13_01510 [Candidatus Omnitrophota bacterium]|nr:hypothetical protein [Candidatus Omnitrophota bacterium]
MPSKRVSIKIISAIISLIFLFASITPSFASSALRPNLMSEGDRLSATVGLVAEADSALQAEVSDYFKIANWIAGILNIKVNYIIEELKGGRVVFFEARRTLGTGLGYDIETHTVVINFRIGRVLKFIDTTHLLSLYGSYRRSMGSASLSKSSVEPIPEEITRLASRLLPRSKIKGIVEYPYGEWFFEPEDRNGGLVKSLRRILSSI